jgi:hypothetical protein
MENKIKTYEVLLRIEIGPEEDDVTIEDLLNFQEVEDCFDVKIRVMAQASPCFDLKFLDSIGQL